MAVYFSSCFQRVEELDLRKRLAVFVEASGTARNSSLGRRPKGDVVGADYDCLGVDIFVTGVELDHGLRRVDSNRTGRSDIRGTVAFIRLSFTVSAVSTNPPVL